MRSTPSMTGVHCKNTSSTLRGGGGGEGGREVGREGGGGREGWGSKGETRSMLC